MEESNGPLYSSAANKYQDKKQSDSIVQALRDKGHNVTTNAPLTDVHGLSYFEEKITAHADSRKGGAQGSAQF